MIAVDFLSIHSKASFDSQSSQFFDFRIFSFSRISFTIFLLFERISTDKRLMDGGLAGMELMLRRLGFKVDKYFKVKML